MTEQKTETQHEHIVEQYFNLIRELRAGKQFAIQALTDLWDADGVFEFAGAPPVTGTFKGKAAIQTLYKNRCNSAGMPLKLEVKGLQEEAGAWSAPSCLVLDGPSLSGFDQRTPHCSNNSPRSQSKPADIVHCQSLRLKSRRVLMFGRDNDLQTTDLAIFEGECMAASNFETSSVLFDRPECPRRLKEHLRGQGIFFSPPSPQNSLTDSYKITVQ